MVKGSFCESNSFPQQHHLTCGLLAEAIVPKRWHFRNEWIHVKRRHSRQLIIATAKFYFEWNEWSVWLVAQRDCGFGEIISFLSNQNSNFPFDKECVRASALQQFHAHIQWTDPIQLRTLSLTECSEHHSLSFIYRWIFF